MMVKQRRTQPVLTQRLLLLLLPLLVRLLLLMKI
jgi:hypothetical protein